MYKPKYISARTFHKLSLWFLVLLKLVFLVNIKKAAVTEGGVDAVLRQQLDLAQEEIEKYKNLEVEQQQQRAEEKSRKRHVETNTPEMDITMIKELTAQIKNKDIDLDLAKDALYRIVFTFRV